MCLNVDLTIPHLVPHLYTQQIKVCCLGPLHIFQRLVRRSSEAVAMQRLSNDTESKAAAERVAKAPLKRGDGWHATDATDEEVERCG